MTHIERFMFGFEREFSKKIRGIYDFRFDLRSEVVKSIYGRDNSAVNVYDINGDLITTAIVNRSKLISDPIREAKEVAENVIRNWGK